MSSILAKLNMSSLSAESGGLLYRGRNPDGLAAAGVPADVVLGVVKSWLKTEIDSVAEGLRNQVITPGAGQAMEYQEVYAQAQAATAATTPVTATMFPMLAATIGVDVDPSTSAPATDVLGVARSVIAGFTAWSTIGAAIRGTRLKAKAAIDQTTSLTDAVAAYDAVAWPALPA